MSILNNFRKKKTRQRLRKAERAASKGDLQAWARQTKRAQRSFAKTKEYQYGDAQLPIVAAPPGVAEDAVRALFPSYFGG